MTLLIIIVDTVNYYIDTNRYECNNTFINNRRISIMQHFKLLPINNILESVYYKHIYICTYNPKHIKYKSLYYHTRGDVKGGVKGKLSDDDITMIKYLCLNLKRHKIQNKDIAKYYNVSRPAISKISSGELFDKHIAEFETTINGGIYKMVDCNKLNMWRDENNGDINRVVNNISHTIKTHKTL